MAVVLSVVLRFRFAAIVPRGESGWNRDLFRPPIHVMIRICWSKAFLFYNFSLHRVRELVFLTLANISDGRKKQGVPHRDLSQQTRKSTAHKRVWAGVKQPPASWFAGRYHALLGVVAYKNVPPALQSTSAVLPF